MLEPSSATSGTGGTRNSGSGLRIDGPGITTIRMTAGSWRRPALSTYGAIHTLLTGGTHWSPLVPGAV